MNLEDKFPKTIFTQKYIDKYGLDKAISKQLEVVSGELFEVRDAFSKKEYNHAIEECVDSIQAIYTTLYMIPGYNNDKIETIIEEVIEKNKKRGYYVK